MCKDQKQLVKKGQVKPVKKTLATVSVALIILIGASAVCGGFSLGKHKNVDTMDAVQTQKYYTSIEIKKGDSLWSIAKAYMSDEYDSVYEYINELKTINELDSDRINETEYLTVAYYL